MHDDAAGRIIRANLRDGARLRVPELLLSPDRPSVTRATSEGPRADPPPGQDPEGASCRLPASRTWRLPSQAESTAHIHSTSSAWQSPPPGPATIQADKMFVGLCRNSRRRSFQGCETQRL